LASGALNDLDHPVDDIQAQLDKVSAGSQVDTELAALKAELATGAPAALGDGEDETPADAEIVEPAVPSAEDHGTAPDASVSTPGKEA
jgi:phage shock protein A